MTYQTETGQLRDYIVALTKQRDELLAALKHIAATSDQRASADGWWLGDLADKAIAKAEEKHD